MHCAGLQDLRALSSCLVIPELTPSLPAAACTTAPAVISNPPLTVIPTPPSVQVCWVVQGMGCPLLLFLTLHLPNDDLDDGPNADPNPDPNLDPIRCVLVWKTNESYAAVTFPLRQRLRLRLQLRPYQRASLQPTTLLVSSLSALDGTMRRSYQSLCLFTWTILPM